MLHYLNIVLYKYNITEIIIHITINKYLYAYYVCSKWTLKIEIGPYLSCKNLLLISHFVLRLYRQCIFIYKINNKMSSKSYV